MKPTEIRCFDKSQEEATRSQTSEVLDCACQTTENAPDDHAGRQVERRLSSLVKEQIRRNLHSYVTNEEDRNGCLLLVSIYISSTCDVTYLILHAAQVQLILETCQSNRSNVVAI
jgi:hypothetical protein